MPKPLTLQVWHLPEGGQVWGCPSLANTQAGSWGSSPSGRWAWEDWRTFGNQYGSPSWNPSTQKTEARGCCELQPIPGYAVRLWLNYLHTWSPVSGGVWGGHGILWRHSLAEGQSLGQALRAHSLAPLVFSLCFLFAVQDVSSQCSSCCQLCSVLPCLPLPGWTLTLLQS